MIYSLYTRMYPSTETVHDIADLHATGMLYTESLVACVASLCFQKIYRVFKA